MAIHAKREITQADAASKSKHTDLSTMRSCDRTKQILFGPIRWVNHHCDANTQFYLLDDYNQFAITLKAIRPIRAGDEITVDYGADFFAAGECRCSACVLPPPAKISVGPHNRRPVVWTKKPESGPRATSDGIYKRQMRRGENQGDGKSM
ncbi:hypothetical protein B0H14DRAFT_3780139 [Mycena olivaceomarginata]|nr:hypothetical protein B0H14DRAFT_3780139 [Mycena olivaceomarginata]